MYTLRFQRKWEGAHRLISGRNANTLCSQPHGHTWSVAVELELKKEVPLNGEDNVLVLFAAAKKTWHHWIDSAIDHSFFFNQRDPMLDFIVRENPQGRHVVMHGDPTTEMVAATFKAKLEAFLKAEGDLLTCRALTIFETQTNSVSLTGDPHLHLPKGGSAWWDRADMTTHDLAIEPVLPRRMN